MLFVALTIFLSIPAGICLDPSLNSQHIFNAIHSSMRQWGSSLNHNGVSFFLATVPRGTHLYHGRGWPDKVTGMEWLAFEPEHASNFALRLCDENPPPNTAKSAKWWYSEYLDTILQSDSVGIQSPERGQDVLAEPDALLKDGRRRPFPFCLVPGWLHTFAPFRDLHLLYVDGMAAAKSELGTLDSQDRILLRNTSNWPSKNLFNDLKRAKNLCRLAKDAYAGKIDGYIRMEHGFEIVLCDFSLLEGISVLHQQDGQNWESLFPAIADRYFDIGGGRVLLNYEHFVSAYNYPDLDLFADSTDGLLPNISGISDIAAARIAADVRDLVLNYPFPSSKSPSKDWRAVADLYTTRYAHRLLYLSSSEMLSSAAAFANATRDIYKPYLDASEPPRRDEEISRCTSAFLSPLPDPASDPKVQVAEHAIKEVANRICVTLNEVIYSEDLFFQKARLQSLMEWLRWTQWKYCVPGCGLGEVCFVATWPFGRKEDHVKPSCVPAGELHRRWGYWSSPNAPIYEGPGI